MSSKTSSYVVLNNQAKKISVEVSHSLGLPGLVIIGLPKKAVVEARERIKSAVYQSGLRLKSKRTVINLQPTHLPKKSAGLDLAIMMAVFGENEIVKNDLSDYIFLAEIGLDGSLRPVKGLLYILNSIKGSQKIIISQENAAEARLSSRHHIYSYRNLTEVINHFRRPDLPKAVQGISKAKYLQTNKAQSSVVNVYTTQARSLKIAATGRHHCLFIGPPGSGKTTSANLLEKLQPKLSYDEACEVTAHSSVQTPQKKLQTQRPYIAPHHSISRKTLLGSLTTLSPGLVTKAHRGILFLDELTSFKKDVLQALREPLEKKSITLDNTFDSVTHHCDFQLVAAANPCPCGHYGSSSQQCNCSPSQRKAFLEKVTSPLLDRFEMIIWLESSYDTTQFEKMFPPLTYIEKKPRKIEHLEHLLSKKAASLLKRKREASLLSYRSRLNILSLAETIALLDTKLDYISEEALLEALHYQYSFN